MTFVRKQKYKDSKWISEKQKPSRTDSYCSNTSNKPSRKKSNLPLYMGIVDIMKAYDSVQQELLWKILKQIGLPPRFIKMTKLIYNSIECKVKIGGKYSEPFRVLTGLLQGNCSSLRGGYDPNRSWNVPCGQEGSWNVLECSRMLRAHGLKV